MRICWKDRVSNQEVLERASTTSIEAMIIKAQLRWTDHVIRMEESRIPRQLFYGDLTEGKRNPGRPKKRYKDNLKANLKWAGIEPKELETAASNRSGWRATTMSATRSFENNRRLCIAAARDRRKRATNYGVRKWTKLPIPFRGVAAPLRGANHITVSSFLFRRGVVFSFRRFYFVVASCFRFVMFLFRRGV